MVYLLLGLQLLTLVFAIAFLGTAAAVLFHWNQVLPFVPIKRVYAKKMVELLELNKDDRVVDIGSGWGSLIFQLAKQDVSVTGIEKSRTLHMIASFRRLVSPNKKRITLIKGNAFDQTYSGFTHIVGWWIPPFITYRACHC